VIGIAASAGGPAALSTIFPHLAGLPAPVLVVQHLSPSFIDVFAEWMARVSALPVEMARDRVRLRPGTVYIGPPEMHLKLGMGRTVMLDQAPPSLHRPSADELFRSLAAHAGKAGIGVVLSGMGDDGAVGLLALRDAGGTTLVQDRASSAVHGMPGAAQRLDAASRTVPLQRIPAAIQAAVRELTG
jgi:two-component system chemotaxis response regulator CheB